jgi:hypothetical protein
LDTGSRKNCITKRFACFVTALAFACTAPGVSAAVLHDELFDGDLPGSIATIPTLQLSLGSNKVRTLTGPADRDRLDSYALNLPSDGFLQSIVIDGYAPGIAGGSTGFTLLTAAGANVGGLVVTEAAIGRDVFVNFKSFIAVEGSRFSVVESDAPAQLQVDFVVASLPGVTAPTPVPVPPAFGLLGAGIAALAALGRRRCRDEQRQRRVGVF